MRFLLKGCLVPLLKYLQCEEERSEHGGIRKNTDVGNGLLGSRV